MKIIKNSPIIKNITNSAIKAWNGEEKLWKVFWLWGGLFYISNFCIILFGNGFLESLSYDKLGNLNILIAIFALFYSIFIFLCAFTIAFIYPMIFLIALNRCCHDELLKVGVKLFAIFAICGHFLFAMLCGMEMFLSFGGTSDSAYLVVKKITDYIYNKGASDYHFDKEHYILLTGLIYLIILCYLINALVRFFNQNTKLMIKKLPEFFSIIIKSMLVSFLLFFLFLFLWLPYYFPTKEEKFFYDNILESSKDKKEFMLLKSLIRFKYDYVCFILSYDETRTKSDYEKIIGFDFDGEVPESGDAFFEDNGAILLFINKNNKESMLINFDRMYGGHNPGNVCLKDENLILIPKITENYNKGFFSFNHTFLIKQQTTNNK